MLKPSYLGYSVFVEVLTPKAQLPYYTVVVSILVRVDNFVLFCPDLHVPFLSYLSPGCPLLSRDGDLRLRTYRQT